MDYFKVKKVWHFWSSFMGRIITLLSISRTIFGVQLMIQWELPRKLNFYCVVWQSESIVLNTFCFCILILLHVHHVLNLNVQSEKKIHKHQCMTSQWYTGYKYTQSLWRYRDMYTSTYKWAPHMPYLTHKNKFVLLLMPVQLYTLYIILYLWKKFF